MNTRQAGFSLIELIVALMLSTLVVGFVASIVTVPAQAHFAQARRSELAAQAEAVTQAMSQDVHRALPNSLRTGVIGGRAAARNGQ
jgi:MSHA biogenesis protein MshO